MVLTALEDGVWVRLYEEGGERLLERTLKQGEAVTVPAAATDPRINTGRPDALSVTVGGQAVAKISDRPETISGVPGFRRSAAGARGGSGGSGRCRAASALACSVPAHHHAAHRNSEPISGDGRSRGSAANRSRRGQQPRTSGRNRRLHRAVNPFPVD